MAIADLTEQVSYMSYSLNSLKSSYAKIGLLTSKCQGAVEAFRSLSVKEEMKIVVFSGPAGIRTPDLQLSSLLGGSAFRLPRSQ